MPVQYCVNDRNLTSLNVGDPFHGETDIFSLQSLGRVTNSFEHIVCCGKSAI